MSWVITPQLKVLNGVSQESIIGIPFGGGYFAGYISHTANGSPTHALIVAPRAPGATGTGYTLTTNLTLKTSLGSTANTTSAFDGAANTAAMVAAGIASHPAAEFCTLLTINGFNDWYLPARYELDIAYYNLKPTTTLNSTNTGANPYSVPARAQSYTTSLPGQTLALAFTTSSEAFVSSSHWSSTEFNVNTNYELSFANGTQNTSQKTTQRGVRAFRRIAL